MANWKEGDRVRIVTRAVTEEDRKKNRYFDHMAGLIGTVQNVYAGDEIAVNIDLDVISKVSRDVHKESQTRMREKIQEEHKKQLTKEEADFIPHYMLLVASNDLEKA